MDAGMVGGIAGGVIGCMGGVIGTYFSLVNASRPRERALTIWFAVGFWLWIAAVLTFALLAPRPWGRLAPMGTLVTVAIPWCDRKLALARARDEADRAGLANDGRSVA
jgi:hypothetical protein